MSENTETKNRTIVILRKLFLDGEKIQNDYREHGSEMDAKARGWVERARVLFTYLFYNVKFLEDFENILRQANSPFGDYIDYRLAIDLLLGHIHGIGLSIKNGYIKDQYSGVDNSTSRDVFVAMSFALDLEDNYIIGIEPALKELGFNPIRVDKVQHNEKIDTKIFQLIAKSRFVIADFTGQRAGVYYEAGYAAGLGLPVVQICKSSDLEKLHFDIKTINTLKFDTPSKLRPELIEHIEKTIGRYREQGMDIMDIEDNMPF